MTCPVFPIVVFGAGDNLDLDTDFLTDGLFAIRLYDPATQTYKVVANMERGRWYPSVTIMADGNLLIVAGMQEVSSAGQHTTPTIPRDSAGLPGEAVWKILLSTNGQVKLHFAAYADLYLLRLHSVCGFRHDQH